MYIKKVRISNYKSFNGTQDVLLSRGINLVVGKNNVGKTAFLETLTFNVNNPHLSDKKDFGLDSSLLEPSQITGRLTIKPEEFKRFIFNTSKKPFFLSISLLSDYQIDSTGIMFSGFASHDTQREMLQLQSIGASPDPNSFYYEVRRETAEKALEKMYEYFSGEFTSSISIGRERLCSFENFHRKPVSESPVKCFGIELRGGSYILTGLYTQAKDVAYEFINKIVEESIYKFDIHRRIGYNVNLAVKSHLLPDCSNLPSMLASFQADTPLFNQYKEAVKKVLPDISEIIIGLEGGEAEIKLWNRPPIPGRIDLAIPLKDSGTGVGQVLAILYIVIASTTPKVLIIDEPNSFLHPSASRRLISILREYSHHQYIISTHSPEIIASNPDNLIFLTLEDGETKVKVLETKQKQNIQYAMQEIGLKLSDVYGFDSILWVEGPTEQVCFPKIISRFYPKLEGNIAIVAVRHTGDFEKKYIDTTYSLYEKISGTGSESFLIPPAVAFVFDREGKSEKEIVDWIRGGKKIHFTEVRLYENYVLDEDAIAFVLNGYSAQYEWNRVYTPEEISDWFEAKKVDPKYWDNDPKYWDKNKKELEEKWKDKIHAAKLLEDLFTELSETRVSYQKTIDSVELTEYLLENKPEAFDSLKQLLDKFLPK
ncbi:ATP-dependent nuclease [Haliscomenobacter hydrossis]|uniref:Uncharacterized protein n=1 Tax=Haliscomenobacter hydrossis (strain ATCC 27775 / DSM 1100 / LMG 10767 / O) TaxID=760192 RepID=F4L6J0_HALH1|nr:AAA family ATPase [Haliscomenobacter hydrossis]AEE49833.1 hypothetical protein Halhy_1948 [Haliscomenobacter hydrossis DSM 1100]